MKDKQIRFIARIFRNTLSIILIIMLAFLLFACSEDEPQPEDMGTCIYERIVYTRPAPGEPTSRYIGCVDQPYYQSTNKDRFTQPCNCN